MTDLVSRGDADAFRPVGSEDVIRAGEALHDPAEQRGAVQFQRREGLHGGGGKTRRAPGLHCPSKKAGGRGGACMMPDRSTSRFKESCETSPSVSSGAMASRYGSRLWGSSSADALSLLFCSGGTYQAVQDIYL